MTLILRLVGESKKSDDSAPADTTAPSALTSVLNTVPAPLARQLELTANEGTIVTFTVTDGTASWTRSDTTLASSHSLPVLGMKPGTDYTLTATITDAAGNDTTLPGIDFTTDVLPTAFPQIVKNMVDNSAAEPGVILFDVHPFNQTDGASLNQGAFYLIAVDESGDVVWYLDTGDTTAYEVRRLANGNLVYIDRGDSAMSVGRSPRSNA